MESVKEWAVLADINDMMNGDPSRFEAAIVSMELRTRWLGSHVSLTRPKLPVTPSQVAVLSFLAVLLQ
jgi:hypothetical protein